MQRGCRCRPSTAAERGERRVAEQTYRHPTYRDDVEDPVAADRLAGAGGHRRCRLPAPWLPLEPIPTISPEQPSAGGAQRADPALALPAPSLLSRRDLPVWTPAEPGRDAIRGFRASVESGSYDPGRDDRGCGHGDIHRLDLAGAAVDILRRSTEGVPHGIRFPLLRQFMWWVPVPVPSLVSATLALLVIRMRRPRPAWRRLAYQPGATACAGVALVLACQSFLILVGIGLKPNPGDDLRRLGGRPLPPRTGGIIRGSTGVGLAVIGSWLVLAWGRRWRAEASWVDRAGRLIGACWIALFVIQRTLAFMMAA